MYWIMCRLYKIGYPEKALTVDGTPQGYTPREEEKMTTPEEIAKDLIKAIKRRRNLVILTFEGKMTAIVKRIAPRLVEHIAYRKMARNPKSPLARTTEIKPPVLVPRTGTTNLKP